MRILSLTIIVCSLVITSCGEKQTNTPGSTDDKNSSPKAVMSLPTSTSSDPRLEKFTGTWGGSGEGALGTCGKDPVMISQDGVKVGNETYPIAFDAEGDIPLMGGATALRSENKDTLLYFNSDGLELEMKRCN